MATKTSKNSPSQLYCFRWFGVAAAGLLLVAGLSLTAGSVFAQKNDDRLTVRVKDVAEIEGVRGNQLIGYGLVVGLNRTGDRVQQNLYARQSLQNLLERMGMTTTVDTLKPENIATVIVTATLPP